MMKLLLSYYFLLLVVATSCTAGREREVLISPNPTVYNICTRIAGVIRRDISQELAAGRRNTKWGSCKSSFASLESTMAQRIYCSEELNKYGSVK